MGREGAGARFPVWGTVHVSSLGALHTPSSSIPAGPFSVGKVLPFNALSPCHSPLRALAASEMCLEEFTIVVAFCLGSFSSGKTICLHWVLWKKCLEMNLIGNENSFSVLLFIFWDMNENSYFFPHFTENFSSMRTYLWSDV